MLKDVGLVHKFFTIRSRDSFLFFHLRTKELCWSLTVCVKKAFCMPVCTMHVHNALTIHQMYLESYSWYQGNQTEQCCHRLAWSSWLHWQIQCLCMLLFPYVSAQHVLFVDVDCIVEVFAFVCVCVCMWVSERERETDREMYTYIILFYREREWINYECALQVCVTSVHVLCTCIANHPAAMCGTLQLTLLHLSQCTKIYSLNSLADSGPSIPVQWASFSLNTVCKLSSLGGFLQLVYNKSYISSVTEEELKLML